MPNTSKQNNNQSDLMEINETNDIQASKNTNLCFISVEYVKNKCNMMGLFS